MHRARDKSAVVVVGQADESDDSEEGSVCGERGPVLAECHSAPPCEPERSRPAPGVVADRPSLLPSLLEESNAHLEASVTGLCRAPYSHHSARLASLTRRVISAHKTVQAVCPPLLLRASADLASVKLGLERVASVLPQ